MRQATAIIREANFDDINGIMDLMARSNLENKNITVQEWIHLWNGNPMFLKLKQRWPIGWVSENANRQIVGFFANIPTRYVYQDMNLIAAVASTWIVDSEYRKYSMSLVRTYFSQDYPDLFIDTTANYIAGRVFSSFFKAAKMPVYTFDRVLFWVIDYKNFIETFFVKNKLPSAKIISYPCFIFSNASKRIREIFNHLRKPRYEIHCIEKFDERFDVFWENLKERKNILLCVRDSQTLSWHYKFPLTNKKVWILIVEKGSRMISYAVFLRQDNPRIGLKRMRLVDFQTLEDDPRILIEMVSYALKKCYNDNIHVLEAIGFNLEKLRIMGRLCPYARKLPNWPFFYKVKNPLLNEKLKNPESWDPSFYDGDVSL